MARRRTIPFYLILFLILGVLPAFAGQATLTGPARCTMPDHLEMQAPPFAQLSGTQAVPAAASSLPVESRQEERVAAPQEEPMIAQSATDSEQQVVVNTVCAR